MNQLDWEKMRENLNIVNFESVTHSPWFSAQSEYTVNTGSRTGGSYVDTASLDSNFEAFIEESSTGPSNTTLVDAVSFEGGWPPSGWNETGNWDKRSNYALDETYSADFEGSGGGSSGYLNSPIMDCTNADSIYVDFWWYDLGLDNDDFELEYCDGNTWDSYQDLNQLDSENGWHHYTEALTDSQYFVSNFQIRWRAKSVRNGERACVDLVTIKRIDAEDHQFDLNGSLTIDLSSYPRAYIETVEAQVVYRVDDSAENWHLQAYNWTTSTYSDNGFNSTTGHNPTTGWDGYAVNFTNVWQSYVHNNGTINLKFADQGGDSAQTSIDLDFLGVRVKMDGTRFTFENDGGLTVHLISLWINNSTNHQHYDINVFVNSAETGVYLHNDVSLPRGDYTVKVVTERGNIAVYSGN